MNIIINKEINYIELSEIIKSCYPNAICIFDGPFLTLDFNNKVRYTIWLKKTNMFEVIPQKAIWNRTFEMKAKAQEISIRIKEFIENGIDITSLGNEISSICPICKNPNTNKIKECEWCGSKIK